MYQKRISSTFYNRSLFLSCFLKMAVFPLYRAQIFPRSRSQRSSYKHFRHLLRRSVTHSLFTAFRIFRASKHSRSSKEPNILLFSKGPICKTIRFSQKLLGRYSTGKNKVSDRCVLNYLCPNALFQHLMRLLTIQPQWVGDTAQKKSSRQQHKPGLVNQTFFKSGENASTFLGQQQKDFFSLHATHYEYRRGTGVK